jgi:hypothetical protein
VEWGQSTLLFHGLVTEPFEKGGDCPISPTVTAKVPVDNLIAKRNKQMGVFAKILLQLLAAAILLVIGFVFPSALANTLSWLDATLASLADSAESTGTIKLILQFAGAGFSVLMTALVITTGFAMRQFVSETFFRWRYVLTAGLIPLLAHVVKWGLGLWWPALLVPVHSLTGVVYNWFSAETQIQLDLFNFKGHVMTIILSLVLIMLWSLATFLWRQLRRRQGQPQPPAPTGKWSTIMSNYLLKPVQWAWGKTKFAVTKVRSWFRKNPAPNPQPPAPTKPKETQQRRQRGIHLGPVTIWFFLFGLMAGLAALPVIPIFVGRYFLGNGGPHDLKLLLLCISGLALIGITLVSSKNMSSIPTAKMAALTILGSRVRIYLHEGNYFIDLDNWFLGRSHKVMMPFTDPDGLISDGDVPFSLWDSSDLDPNKGPNLTIGLNALHGAAVKLRVTLLSWVYDPVALLSPSDASLLLGDSGRKALRSASGKFTDTDIDNTPPLMAALLLGQAIIGARLSSEVGTNLHGSLAYDKGGNRLFKILPLNTSDVEIDQAKADFAKWLKSQKATIADEVWAAITTGDTPSVEAIQIESSVLTTGHDAGIEIRTAYVSDFSFSEQKQEAVDKASREPFEKVSERSTAKSAAQAAAEFAGAEKTHGANATMLGAAAVGTPGVTTVNIPGLAGLAQALTALVAPNPKGTK